MYRDFAPDVVLSFLDVMNVPVLLAAWGMAVPVVVSERVDPAHLRLSRARSIVRNLAYRRAAAIVVQTAVVRERFPRVPRLALTATADPPTRREIAAKLGLDDAEAFVGGYPKGIDFEVRVGMRGAAGRDHRLQLR